VSIVWWWTRSGMGKESAPLLLGLAWHAQRRTWEDQKTILADRVAAVFADSIAAVQDPLERVLALLRHLAGVVDQRDLLLALEGLGAGVCLVVAALVAAAFVVFRAVTRDEGAEADLAVPFLAVALVAALFLAVALVVVGFAAVVFVAVRFVEVARAGATFLAATVALAAVARTALTTLAPVVLAGVALAVPFEDGAVLSAGPPFFADIAFFTAILGPFKVAVDRPRERGQVA